MVSGEFFLFFFSSRRRHTRWNCDWSSDVCSSDLEPQGRLEVLGKESLQAAHASGVKVAPLRGLLVVVIHNSINKHHLSIVRSEERRVGKECRSRWSPDH